MIKKVILPLFIIIIGIVIYLLVEATIERSVFSIQKLTDYLENPSRNSPLSQGSLADVKQLSSKHKADLVALEHLKSITMALLFFCALWLIASIAYKPNFAIKKYDGLTLMIAHFLLILAVFAIFQRFTDGRFEDGNNATIDIRISIEIIMLIITPLMFFATFKLNKSEIAKKLHSANWITYLALSLALLIGLFALILGIAILLTPDVSNFTS